MRDETVLRQRVQNYIAGAMPGHVTLVAPFVVYILTLAPTVTFWDSGELCYAAMELGVPHHPGYPVYVQLAKAATLFPLGNVAFRVAVFSAVCSSLAAYVLYRTLAGIEGGTAVSSWAASSVATGFVLSPLVWPQAVVAEVYGLHILLLSSAVYMAARFEYTGRAAFLMAACFLVGLSFANHHTTIFVLPAAAVYLLSDRRARSGAGLLLAGAFFMVLGASPYLYLPLRAATGPAINLGDPETLGGFMYLMRWDIYLRTAARRLADPAGLLGGVWAGAGVYGAAAALSGAAAFAAAVYTSKRRGFIASLLVAGAMFIAGVYFLSSGDTVGRRFGLQSKFYMPVAVFWATASFAWCSDRLKPGSRIRTGVLLSVIALGVFATGLSLENNYEQYSNTDNYYASDFAENTLKSADEGGVLFAWGDSGVFPAWYLQGVEKYREDVLLVYTPILNNRWYFLQVADELRSRYGVQRPKPYESLVVEGNLGRVMDALGGEVPVSYDYTAMLSLERDYMEYLPVGMLWRPRNGVGSLDGRKAWSHMVVRVEDPAGVSKEVVAEDIFYIYGYQAFWWGEYERMAGRDAYAREAYYKAAFYGFEPELSLSRIGQLDGRKKL